MRILILFLTSYFFLLGCSQKKSSTTLKVSASFAAGNSQFEGGMVVVGRGPNNSFFSKPLSASEGSNSITMTLPFGRWSFQVIGWDGDDAGSIATPTMKGFTYCEDATVDLNESNATINLVATKAKCTSSRFGNSIHFDSSAQKFKNIIAGTCGVLYRDKDANELHSTDKASNWCFVSGLLPRDFQGEPIGSMRISVLNVDLGGQMVSTNILSECIGGALMSSGSATLPHRLPSRILPVQIDLFRSNDCQETPEFERVTSYVFRDGLEGSYNFDHRFASVPDSPFPKPNLFLPSNKTQRGFTPFKNIFPSISCNGGQSCLAPPLIPSGVDRYFTRGGRIILTANRGLLGCDDLGTIELEESAVPVAGFSPDCWEEENLLLVGIDYPGDECTATPCDLKFGSASHLDLPVKREDQGILQAYDKFFELVGTTSPLTAEDVNYQSLFKEDGSVYGILGDPREMFSPEGPGGLFSKDINCASFTGQRTVSFFEDGRAKSYQIEISNSTLPIPRYFCADGNPASNCGGTPRFQKKMTIRRPSPPSFVTEEVIHFHCTRKVGLSERQLDEVQDGERSIEKKIIAWNTTIPNQSRIDLISDDREFFFGTNDVRSVQTSYVRVERSAASDATDVVRSKSLNYDAHRNDPMDDFREHASQITGDYSNHIFYTTTSRAEIQEVPSLGIIFQDPFFNRVLNSLSSSPFESTVSNSFGDLVSAVSVPDGVTYDLKLTYRKADGTLTVNLIDVNSESPIKPKAMIDGSAETHPRKPAVVFLAQSSGLNYGFALRFNGTSWVDKNGNAFSFATSKVDATVASAIDIVSTDEVDGKFAVVYGLTISNVMSMMRFGFDGSAFHPAETLTTTTSSPYLFSDIEAILNLPSASVYVIGNIQNANDNTLVGIQCSRASMSAATHACGTSVTSGVLMSPSVSEVRLENVGSDVAVYRPTQSDTEVTNLLNGGSFESPILFPATDLSSNSGIPHCLNRGSFLTTNVPFTNLNCKPLDDSFVPQSIRSGRHMKLKDLSPSQVNSFFTPASVFRAQ